MGLPGRVVHRIVDEIVVHARAMKLFLEKGLPYLAQAVAFQALLSFVPFLLLVASFWGIFFGGDEEAARRLSATLNVVIPFGAPTINSTLATFEANRGIFTAVSLGALVYLASSVFRTVDYSINIAFDTHEKRGAILAQIKGLLLVLAFGILMGVWSLGTSFLTVLARRIPSNLPRAVLLSESAVTGVLVPIAVLSVVFTALLHLLPHAPVRWRDALRGGVLTALLWLGALRVFSRILARAMAYNLVSGTLAGIVAFLLWIYYASCLFLYGASLVATLSHAKPRS
ncbi:MAG: YihY/virulence factor BrkB family protein [Acidobacteriota bacterium]